MKQYDIVIRVCKSTLNIETNIETLKKSTLTLCRFSMLKFSTLTLYWIQCFRVNILKNCSMFSMSQCFSMFLNVSQCFSMFLNVSQFFPNFFDIFGQRGRLNFNFRTNFSLLIKNKKPNMELNICLLWTISCYLKMLTTFEKIATLKHWIEFNVEIWHRIEFQCFNVHFFDIENFE
jgi:hypothetical protein